MSKNKNIFTDLESPRIPKSVQNLSHTVKLSCKMGELIPVTYIDCLPGQKLRLDNEALVRTMPMVTPPMERFNVTFHRFFVPKRLLWDHWDEYVSLTKVGTPAVLPAHPYIEVVPLNPIPRLFNYMGVPKVTDIVNQVVPVRINPLRFYAYQLIYDEYYRDQNLIPSDFMKAFDGDNSSVYSQLNMLRKRAWKHDYFTSALPFVQKGDPVLMPGGNIVLKPLWNTPSATPAWQNASGGYSTGDEFLKQDLNPPHDGIYLDGSTPEEKVAYDPDGTLIQEAATINDFRRANAIQRFQERLARVGSRFTEFLKGVFNVRSRDSRLQRPEFVGGLVKPITISEVLNTTGTADAPQGAMAGHGATYIDGSQSNYFCEEHGYLITIMNIQPNGSYFQGFDKEFFKINHPTEIYVPDLANLGEQPIINNELWAYGAAGADEFGYVPRWSEHRYIPDRVCGEMDDTLLFWTAARFFENQPALNQTFIEADQEFAADRVFAVPDPAEDKLVCQIYNTVMSISPVPAHGTPSL